MFDIMRPPKVKRHLVGIDVMQQVEKDKPVIVENRKWILGVG